jgi:mono/diheme cytochrome c family protein
MIMRIVIVFAIIVAALAAMVAWLNFREEDGIPQATAAFSPTPAQIQRGQYLARAGNCIACHTKRGGEPYAGGLGVRTPFGTVYSTNITPDAKTGIGTWSSAHFWRAMHNGRSKDGRLLYPAFPYPNYTQITREDSDAIFAFLWSLPPAEQIKRPPTCVFHITTSSLSPCGAHCFSSPSRFSRTTRSLLSGIVAPTSCADWDIVSPVIAAATCSVRPVKSWS